MPDKRSSKKNAQPAAPAAPSRRAARAASALLDTRIVYCGDCLEQLRELPDGCVDLIYIDPPFNKSSRKLRGLLVCPIRIPSVNGRASCTRRGSSRQHAGRRQLERWSDRLLEGMIA